MSGNTSKGACINKWLGQVLCGTALSGETDITVEMVLRVSPMAANMSQKLLSASAAGWTTGFQILLITHSNGEGAYLQWLNGASSVDSPGFIPFNIVLHVALVRKVSTKTVYFYVNGESLGTAVYTTPTPSRADAYFTVGGMNNAVASDMIGTSIRSVCVVNSALSAAEVLVDAKKCLSWL
jgi:hypothetical protein